MIKSIDKSLLADNQVEEGFLLLKLHNKEKSNERFTRSVDKSFIQLHFCLSGKAKLLFNGGNYALDVPENKSFLHYKPQQDLPIDMSLDPDSADRHREISYLFLTGSRTYTLFKR